MRRPMARSRVLFVLGTRPEAIKLAPVIDELRRDADAFDVRLCVTGQHREMLEQVLRLFDLTPDVDLDLMRPEQDLAQLTAAVLANVASVISDVQPDLVAVQGDTSTAFAAGLAAFYAGVDVAHVEAGLRSGDDRAPWPEEVNRRLLTVLAKIHFAPTDEARSNLEREGVDPSRVHVTGNTVIDALQRVCARIDGDAALRSQLERQFAFLDPNRKLILVTGHRRESFGDGFESICHALAELAREEDLEIVYPVHLNPNVQRPVRGILGSAKRVHLLDPVDYAAMVFLMRRSSLILTDSGGVQEEAPSLGKPVLVLRETTERPEVLRFGNARLVGTDRVEIVSTALRILRDEEERARMSERRDLFGDGRSAERIASVLRERALHSASR
jgi:UDP-N-acetylglucosamine 2-epimerase (non-hydrolysing)